VQRLRGAKAVKSRRGNTMDFDLEHTVISTATELFALR
jgi:hypothetical protein